MAGSVNKVILIGNVGKDPEIRHTQAGAKIASMSIATSESWKDKQSGEKREKTEWHRISIFDEKLAEIVEKYVKKGSKVYVEGSLQTRKWTGNDGVEKYTTEVVLQRFSGVLTMLDNIGGGQEKKNEAPDWDAPNTEKAPAERRTPLKDLDDNIPF
jgi:single-strand DNA-binding protein